MLYKNSKYCCELGYVIDGCKSVCYIIINA